MQPLEAIQMERLFRDVGRYLASGKGQPFDLEGRCWEAIEKEANEPVDMVGVLPDEPTAKGSIWLLGQFIRLIDTKKLGKKRS